MNGGVGTARYRSTVLFDAEHAHLGPLAAPMGDREDKRRISGTNSAVCAPAAVGIVSTTR